MLTETPEAENPDPAGDGSARGGFFAVDRRTWARTCSLGMNAVVAYLVLARGTARDNRTTAWSVQAVEKYTSISRGRAQQALELLAKNGLIEVLREGTRPKYRLRPAHEVSGCEGYPPPALDETERELFELLCSGETWLPSKAEKRWGYRSPRVVAGELVPKGWARELGGNRFEPIRHDA